MAFNSTICVGFILVVVLVHSRVGPRGQNIFLLLASYLFYGYFDWRFNLLLLTSTTVDYLVGHRIYSTEGNSRRKKLLLISLGTNLGILGFFKYFNFFIESTQNILGVFGFHASLPVLQVILPIGISFYTFKTMSYVIDIYRGKRRPATGFVDYALYVSFFPQLQAGPIERAEGLLPQIESRREISAHHIFCGLNLILLGLFKKVAVADILAPVVERVFTNPTTLPSVELLGGIYAFTLQIYGDFSGYTDMSRGVAMLLGFDTMKNFNAPYFSENVMEFWRRWHMSLSTWLRDYLYISLGGNRKGTIRTYLNLIVTMFLGGLWHGAAWTFVIWGAAHGLCLCIHRAVFREKLSSSIRSVPATYQLLKITKIVVTFHIVAVTWVFFKAKDLNTALIYLSRIVNWESGGDIGWAVLVAGLLLMFLDLVQILTRTDTWLIQPGIPWPARYLVVMVMALSIATTFVAHENTFSPFIYFQF